MLLQVPATRSVAGQGNGPAAPQEELVGNADSQTSGPASRESALDAHECFGSVAAGSCFGKSFQLPTFELPASAKPEKTSSYHQRYPT